MHVPHFEVTGLDGRPVTYAGIWQRRNLLLVCLADDTGAAAQQYTTQLDRHAEEMNGLETSLVVTADCIPGLPCPGVTIADRWGEVVHTSHADRAANMPPAHDLLEWLRYVQHRCPECEGEAR